MEKKCDNQLNNDYCLYINNYGYNRKLIVCKNNGVKAEFDHNVEVNVMLPFAINSNNYFGVYYHLGVGSNRKRYINFYKANNISEPFELLHTLEVLGKVIQVSSGQYYSIAIIEDKDENKKLYKIEI